MLDSQLRCNGKLILHHSTGSQTETGYMYPRTSGNFCALKIALSDQ